MSEREEETGKEPSSEAEEALEGEDQKVGVEDSTVPSTHEGNAAGAVAGDEGTDARL